MPRNIWIDATANLDRTNSHCALDASFGWWDLMREALA